MPNAVVKHFHSDMVGAPQLNYAPGSLIAVLDAVLVNGWGAQTANSIVISGGVATVTLPANHPFESQAVAKIEGATPAGLNGEQKVTSAVGNTFTFNTALADQTASGTITVSLPPLGFEKAFSGTNLAAYKIIDPEFVEAFLRVDDTTNYYSRVLGFDTMSDVNTGTGQFPTEAQVAGGLAWYKANNNTGTRKWFIVGTKGTVLVGLAHHATVTEGYGFSVFGNFKSHANGDQYNVSICGSNAPSSYSSESAGHQVGSMSRIDQSSSTIHHYAMRDYLGVTESLKAMLDLEHQSTSSTTFFISGETYWNPYPNQFESALMVAPLKVREGLRPNGFRGTIPGYYHCMNYLGSGEPGSKAKFIPDTTDPEIAGRTLIALVCSSTTGRQFIDLTGPWST